MSFKSGRCPTAGLVVCLWWSLSGCTFYAAFSDDYFPCDENGECPYGGCVCFNDSVCVPVNDQGKPGDCWPCETNEDCDDGDPGTSDACLPEGSCQNLPAEPVCLKPLGTQPSPVGGMGQCITADQNFVYLGLSEGFHGVQIVEVTDPTAMNPRGVFDTDTDPANLGVSRADVLGLDVAGSFLYLATYRGGLVILDVSNPDQPFYTGGLSLGSENWGVQVVGDLAYLARHGGLQIIQVADPKNPVSVGWLNLLGRTQDVHVVDRLAYLASWEHFQVVDVSDPTAPVLLSDLDTVVIAYEVWASPEGYAYLALKIPGKLMVVDATDPKNPEVCWESELGEREYRGIDGRDKKIFLATGTDGASGGGVRVYDIQQPCQPVFKSEAPTDGPAFEVKVAGENVYAALVNGSFTAYKITPDCP